MARNFDGSNDKIEITLNASQTSLDTVSYSWWCRPEGTVGGYRTAFSRSEGTFGTRLELDTGWGWVFAAWWTTTDGKWSVPLPTVNTWTHSVITYNYGSTSNDPIFYRDGTSATVTDRQTPAGTKKNDGTGFAIGYMKPANSFYWDGQICEFGMWNRILTASEAAGLAKGLSPLFYPNGLVFYMPLIGNYSPEIEYRYGSNGTVTEATKYDHPRIMYPAWGKGRRFTTAIGGSPTSVKDLIMAGIIPFAR